MDASCPSLHCSWRKTPVSCRGAKGLVTELSSPRFVMYNTVIVSKYWLPAQLWHSTAAHQWIIVEIEFLATVGWKRGRRPFSCPCSLNVTHCWKELCSTCLSKESMPFVNSKPPFPTRSLRFLRAAVRSASFAVNYGCIIPIPSLQLQKKPVLCEEGESLVTELWSPRIVTIYLLCSYVTAN